MLPILLLVETCPLMPMAPTTPVAQVTVVAESTSLLTGSQTNVTATVTDANGNVLTDRSVTWSSSNPSVASVLPSSPTTALVTGVGPGSGTISAASEGNIGGVPISVTSSTTQSPVAQVAVVADSASLFVGSQTKVTATLTDANGNVLTDRSVSWSSSNTAVATVLTTGPTTAIVTAVAVGSATITATSEGKTGGVSISVTSPQTPPPAGSHEPSGFTAITDRGFDLLSELSWTFGGLNLSIIPDLAAPRSAPNIGQIFYPAGFSGGGEPAWTERVISSLGYTKVYLSFWVKVSSNWQGHDSFVNKIGFVNIHGDPVVFPIIFGKDNGALRSEIRLQNLPGATLARNLPPNLSASEIRRGQWHHWEIVLLVNSGDTANGEAHWWIDGVKAGEYRDILYSTSAQSKIWQQFIWRPIWGGVGDTVLENMFMWMDHFYMSGSP